MATIPIEVLNNLHLQETYIFDYIKENDYIITDRNILILLQDLGYIWHWDENTQKISKIKKGTFNNINIRNIEDVIEETMDIETKNTHSYIANTLVSHNTVNLPNDVKEKEVAEVYREAHKRGIIGVTVYRDGSREGILVHSNGNGSIIERNAPKRPKELPCHVYKIKVTGEDWIVFVGLYKGHPFEVFAGKVGLVNLPSRITEGILIKVKSGLYQFKHEDEVLIKDVTKIFESGAQEALTRQISTNLRHGTPIEYIQEQLQKSHGTIVDFNKAILRALKRYMKEKATNQICESCGAPLIFVEGCLKCPDCGLGKCG
jgi:hypothetical protein